MAVNIWLFLVHYYPLCVNLMYSFPLIGRARLRCAEAEHCWYDGIRESHIYAWHFVGSKYAWWQLFLRSLLRFVMFNWQITIRNIIFSKSFICYNDIEVSSSSMMIEYFVAVTISSCSCLYNFYLRSSPPHLAIFLGNVFIFPFLFVL